MTTRREFLTQAMGAGILIEGSLRRGLGPNGFPGPSTMLPLRADTIETVLGPIDVSQLGLTLAHEHICSVPPLRQGDRSGAVRYMVDKLMAAGDAGIDAIVDCTTFDVGRDVRFGQEVSRRSGVHVVACTGQHFFAPEELSARSVDQIAEVFVRETDEGIEGTEIKAGVIKVAARTEAMTPAEINVFRAAARAHKATGVPIQTHTNARRRAGERQVEIFEAESVRPERVSLAHSDDTDDVSYLLGLARRGYTLGMDHAFYGLAQGAAVPFHRHVEYIKEVMDGGFIDRIMLSTDWELGERELLNPDGLLFVTARTIPHLYRLGLTEQEVRTITVENPARFFARRRA